MSMKEMMWRIRPAAAGGVAACILLAWLCVPVRAEEDPPPAVPPAAEENAAAETQPAGDEADASTAKVEVVAVEGIAQKREAGDPDGDWQPVKVGDELDELTILRTGLGSQVTLKFADRGEFIVRSGTKVGISEFRKEGQFARARLGLKYGSMKASVDSTRGPNDFRVSTPVATLSVRGTAGKYSFSGDMGMNVHGDHGSWLTQSGSRSMRIFSGQKTNHSLALPSRLALQGHTANMGPAGGGMTKPELRNLTHNGGGRGAVGFTGGGAGGSGGGNAGQSAPPPKLGDGRDRDRLGPLIAPAPPSNHPPP